MRWFKPEEAEALSHTYALIPSFSTSSNDFYQAVEAELKAREVPGLTMERVEFHEGGLLSSKREYLRLTRERLVFDVCAAPFGTACFFSCRFAELPITVPLPVVIFLLLLFWGLTAAIWKFLGFFLGTVLLVTAIGLGIWTLRNAVSLGLRDLDAALLRNPFTSAIYQAYFRSETYYRQDTRIMYCEVVNEVVKARVEEVTSAAGIKHVCYQEHNPLLRDLYQPARRQTIES
jgi:hypothetical protein